MEIKNYIHVDDQDLSNNGQRTRTRIGGASFIRTIA